MLPLILCFARRVRGGIFACRRFLVEKMSIYCILIYRAIHRQK